MQDLKSEANVVELENALLRFVAAF